MNSSERAFPVKFGTVKFLGESRPFYFSDTELGLHIAQKVLGGECYLSLRVHANARTVVDIGANIGASTLYFASCYPQARILAFEPFPESYELLVLNVDDLQLVQTFNFGLFDRDQQGTMHLGTRDSVTNSLGMNIETRSDRQVTIELREAAAVFAEQGLTDIDVLKIDTEGCELQILRSLTAWLPRVGVLFLEFHSEADRRELDLMVSPTHMLATATIEQPHRGELCYVRRDLVPDRLHAAAISVE
jgi:FkbM family methyltransferase